MAKSTQKLKVHKEEAKELQTTHWDMDYLPRKELEELYGNVEQNEDGLSSKLQRKSAFRWAIVVGIGAIGLLLLSFLVFKLVSG